MLCPPRSCIRDTPPTRLLFVIIEVISVFRVWTYVTELSYISFAVGYIPGISSTEHTSSAHHILPLAFIQGIKHVSRGVYPVVYRRRRQFYPRLSQYLHLTVFGQMMVILVCLSAWPADLRRQDLRR